MSEQILTILKRKLEDLATSHIDLTNLYYIGNG